MVKVISILDFIESKIKKGVLLWKILQQTAK